MSSRLTLMATSILRLIIGIALIVCGCVFVSLDPTNRQFLLPPGMQKKMKSTQHIYIYIYFCPHQFLKQISMPKLGPKLKMVYPQNMV